MARQVFKQPSRGSRRDDYWPDDTAIRRPSGEKYTRPGSSLDDSTEQSLGNIDDVLAQQEALAASGTSPESTQKGAQDFSKLADAESKPGTPRTDAERAFADNFFNPEGKHPPLKQRLKKIPARRKALAGIGIGGGVGLLLLIFTIFPTFRLPSLMSAIQAIAGHAVEEVAEHRAMRYIIGYAIHTAGGGAVARDTLGGTLWATFRAHKVEAKMLRDTGFEFRVIGGKVHMLHYGEGDRGEHRDPSRATDFGVVESYEDFRQILQTNPQAFRLGKKLIRIYSGNRWLLSSKFRKAMQNRFQLRFAAPKKDESKTKQENQTDFRLASYNVAEKQQGQMMQRIIGCVADDQCDFFKRKGDPINTGGPADNRVEEIREFQQDLTESSNETRAEIEKGFTLDQIEKGVPEKLAVKSASKFVPGYGALSTLATFNHFAKVIDKNNLYVTIPAVAKAYILGAQNAYYMGQAHNIMAGRTDLMFIEVMNKELLGGPAGKRAENSQAYNFIYHGDASKGIPIEARVDDDLENPSHNTFVASWPGYVATDLLLEGIYHFEGLLGEVASMITDFIFGDLASRVLGYFCNEDCQREISQWAINAAIPLIAANVDPAATGYRFLNQVFVGGVVNNMWYMAVALGGKAVTTTKPFHPPIFGVADNPDSTINTIAQGTPSWAVEHMTSLPLKDRLFSLDEPFSLINTVIRNMPSNLTEMAGSVFRQVAALPRMLATTVLGRASAVADVTPQQIADVTGVRQYGFTEEDLAKDISPEIFSQANPECPEVDQETQANLCMADREIAQALICAYEDCPEYMGYEDPNTAEGFVNNAKQLWNTRLPVAIWNLW